MISVTVDEAVEALNSMAKADPVAMGILCQTRVTCMEPLGNHPTVQTGRDPNSGMYVVGMLGIINGIFGTIPEGRFKGWGYIAAMVEKDGTVSGFVKTEVKPE